MAVKQHQLYIELVENIKSWPMPDILLRLEHGPYENIISYGTGVSPSPAQQREYNSYYWCSRVVSTFDRLEWIRAMTSRSVYRRKSETKSVLLEEWIMYNYEHYTVVYQTILEVALLLTNEVFGLGNPYRKCSYSTVCDNTRINGTSVHCILGKLKDTTNKHRGRKNLLVHRGERIRPPLDTVDLIDSTEVINMAIKLGIEIGGEREELPVEFLLIHSQKELIEIMEKECTEIESQVEDLFSALLPYYRKFRSTSF